MNTIGYMQHHWAQNGTKLLGSAAAVLSTAQALLAFVSASPDFALLVPHKYLAVLSLANGVLGIITVRRGFTNSKAQP